MAGKCTKHADRAGCDAAIDRLVESVYAEAVKRFPGDGTRQLAWCLQILGWGALQAEDSPAGASAAPDYPAETETADECAADLARAEL